MLVAVYGTLRKGQHNHHFLTDGELLGMELVCGKYRMADMGAFPAIYPDKENPYPIVVEVYDVDEDTFRDLDSLEGFPRMYDRELIMTKYGDAWIYFMNRAFKSSIIHGDWVKYRNVDRNVLGAE